MGKMAPKIAQMSQAWPAECALYWRPEIESLLSPPMDVFLSSLNLPLLSSALGGKGSAKLRVVAERVMPASHFHLVLSDELLPGTSKRLSVFRGGAHRNKCGNGITLSFIHPISPARVLWQCFCYFFLVLFESSWIYNKSIVLGNIG